MVGGSIERPGFSYRRLPWEDTVLLFPGIGPKDSKTCDPTQAPTLSWDLVGVPWSLGTLHSGPGSGSRVWNSYLLHAQ